MTRWLVLGLGLAFSAPVWAQPDPEDQARGILLQARTADPAAFAVLADQIIGLGEEAIPVVREALKESALSVRYVAARVLISTGEDDGSASQVLVDLVRDGTPDELRILACDLLSEEDEVEAGIALAGLLPKPMTGVLKARVARAVFFLSREHRVQARETLQQLLGSADETNRAEAAFALAEIGQVDVARPVLQKLATRSDLRGRVAALHLRMEEWKRLALESADRRSGEPTTSLDPDLNLIEELINVVRQLHQEGDRFTREALIEAAAAGLVAELDPFSNYLSAAETKEWEFDLNPTYGGIGAYVNLDDDRRIFIVRPIYSGPAYRLDLRSGDRIIRVDGWDTLGSSLDEITSRMKGPPGTKVTLEIFRKGWQKSRTFQIERAQIRIPTVNSDLLPGDVGYIELTTFGEGTGAELEAALADLSSRGMKALILDLRDNSGGYLSAAGQIAGKFLDRQQVICTWKGRNERIAPPETLLSRETQPRRLPLVVLVNEYSASASEIVAGALQDHQRAVLVGVRTFGKGSVQRLLDLSSRPSEPFTDQARKNGFRDPGEPFTDRNENGEWDDGEPFEDRPEYNEVWDPAEPFTDTNGNGQWDEGEAFEDANRNGIFDGPEPFEDLNKNGSYDPGPKVKLTIGRYYLPSGRSIHRERDADGKVISEGGVLPDDLIPNSFLEGWKVEEWTRLREAEPLEQYVERLAATPDTLRRLAVGDGKQTESYPGFEELYGALATPLSRDDVRRVLRSEVRRRASDVRGKEYRADFLEDSQLQRAISRALSQLGVQLDAIPEYAPIAGKIPEPVSAK